MNAISQNDLGINLDEQNSVEVDFTSTSFKENAHALLAEWAKRPPFYLLTNGEVQMFVGRYKDVHEVFSDPERFSSKLNRGKGFEQFDKFMGGQFMTQMDGEQHARLRRLLMPAFSARRLEQLEETIAETIDGLLDKIDQSGAREFDAMNEYAARLVIGVLLTAMLNLDSEQQRVLLEFQEVQPLITATKPGQPYAERVHQSYRDTANVVRTIIEDRRAGLRSDFLRDLVDARDHGDKLNDKELFDHVLGILAALATTPRSASGALYTIYRHPEQLQELIAQPQLIPDAVEECLRIAGNGYFTFPRVATSDTEVGGTPIPKGMIIRQSPQAANYDPDVYFEPTKFDIHRKPKRIMTFGAGPHHCLGNLLGRRTICIAVKKLLERFPEAHLADPAFKPVYGGAVGELRMRELPLRKY